MHLQGAKSIYDTIPANAKFETGFEFLRPWFQYHYIFSQYTYPEHATESEIILPSATQENRKVSQPSIPA